MDIYQYLVKVIKRAEGGWELPLNKEVSLSKNSTGIVELVICSDLVDCTIPINSIRSDGDDIIVNDDIYVEITHEGFLEINLSSEPYSENSIHPDFIEKLIQDGEIYFQLSMGKGDTVYFYDDHTLNYGLFTMDLTNSKIRYLRTTSTDRMEFELEKDVVLSVPKDSKIIFDLHD